MLYPNNVSAIVGTQAVEHFGTLLPNGGRTTQISYTRVWGYTNNYSLKMSLVNGEFLPNNSTFDVTNDSCHTSLIANIGDSYTHSISWEYTYYANSLGVNLTEADVLAKSPTYSERLDKNIIIPSHEARNIEITQRVISKEYGSWTVIFYYNFSQ